MSLREALKAKLFLGADSAVERIMDDLTLRGGFDGVWDSMDDDTRNEITATWARIIKEEVAAADILNDISDQPSAP